MQTSDDPFHPSQCPKPWPLAPFTCPVPLFQKRLPYYLLPEQLVVHDPCNVLAANGGSPLPKPWCKDTAYTPRTYTLSLSPETKILVDRQRQKARIEWEKKHEGAGLCFMWDDALSIKRTGPVDTPLFVPTPPPPPPPFSVPVAHLYLSADQEKGSGNHSKVYTAEWELPRSLFEDPNRQICRGCVVEAVADIFTEQHKAEKEENPDQTPAHPTTSKEKGTMTVSEHLIPGLAFSLVHPHELNPDSEVKAPSPVSDLRRQYNVTGPHVKRSVAYEGNV